jgi:uncharacterized protein (TIGR00369 family)
MTTELEWIRMDEEGLFSRLGPVFRLPIHEGIGHFRFRAEPMHRNRLNYVHGGMLMAFADRGMGVTARRGDAALAVATVQLDMHFMRAARIGEWVGMQCRVLRQTRSLLFVDATLESGGQVVATARGVWKSLGEGLRNGGEGGPNIVESAPNSGEGAAS